MGAKVLVSFAAFVVFLWALAIVVIFLRRPVADDPVAHRQYVPVERPGIIAIPIGATIRISGAYLPCSPTEEGLPYLSYLYDRAMNESSPSSAMDGLAGALIARGAVLVSTGDKITVHANRNNAYRVTVTPHRSFSRPPYQTRALEDCWISAKALER